MIAMGTLHCLHPKSTAGSKAKGLLETLAMVFVTMILLPSTPSPSKKHHLETSHGQEPSYHEGHAVKVQALALDQEALFVVQR